MPLTRNQIDALLENKSIAAVRSWLKSQNLPHSANTRERLTARVFGLLKDGDLTEEEFRRGLLSLEEASAKRVFLYGVECPENPDDHFSQSLRRAHAKLSDEPELAPNLPHKPTLVYVTKRGGVVRAKWAETHESVEPDIERGRFIRRPLTKVIVLQAELGAKTAQVRFDKPEAIHSHKDGDGVTDDRLYFGHYMNAASSLLGMNLTATDVRGPLRSLVETVPRIIRLESKDFRTASNTRVRFSSKTDVRDDGDWKVMHDESGDAWAYDREFVHWLPGTSNGRLRREVFTDIDGRTGKLRVEADCTEEELEYAISTIRAHQN
jgi:hypothetical protein